jgi:hypothetical protein
MRFSSSSTDRLDTSNGSSDFVIKVLTSPQRCGLPDFRCLKRTSILSFALAMASGSMIRFFFAVLDDRLEVVLHVVGDFDDFFLENRQPIALGHVHKRLELADLL